ncbi:uncharacterized protein CGFF_01521 [Nakaseomyces glabratus]|nr:Tho complex subunit 7 [Nakaseomyces glabratus]QNG16613.1 uncharacterized protein GWK60_L15191 [Nakaseomyces glabratus]SCV13964.1 uncharacterized protein CGFF_01521 [Nakaseomyces glabratus]SLM12376.1 uncharacterized protein CGFF_01521 [Nakaseomyces glabratus]
MTLNNEEVKEVKDKVNYGDVDLSFNRYLDVLGKAVSMSDDLLGGNVDEEGQVDTFTKANIEKLKQTAELRFIDAQANIDVKKIGYENWQKYNEKVFKALQDNEDNSSDELERLKLFQENLRDRIKRVSEMYDSVKNINQDLESLSEGKSNLAVSRLDWENELGKDLTEKLINRRYLQDRFGKASKTGNFKKHPRNTGSNNDHDGEALPETTSTSSTDKGNTDDSSRNDSITDIDREQTLTAFDDFSKGPAELKHIQSMLKSDISRLKEEVESYKEKWMNDAELFSKISSLLKDELKDREGTRYPSNDSKSQPANDEDEAESEDEDTNSGRFKRQTVGRAEEVGGEGEEALLADGDDDEEDEEDSSSTSESSYDEEIDNEEKQDIVEEEEDADENDDNFSKSRTPERVDNSNESNEKSDDLLEEGFPQPDADEKEQKQDN